MSGVPTAIEDVHHARKAGWPKRGDPQGHGIPIVVSERESRLHGEGGEAGECAEDETGDMRNAVSEGLTYQDTGKEAVRRL
jgi:hypothetical protein